MLPRRGALHATTASAQGSQNLDKAAAGRAMADCWEQIYDSDLLRVTQLDFKLVGRREAVSTTSAQNAERREPAAGL